MISSEDFQNDRVSVNWESCILPCLSFLHYFWCSDDYWI